MLEEYAKKLYEEGALEIKEKPFLLRSGNLSNIYLDHRGFITRKDNYEFLLDVYAKLLDRMNGFDSICSLDSICSPIICGGISLKCNIDLIVTKENKLEHGINNNIWVTKSTKPILIDDIVSSGNLLIKTIKNLNSHGIYPVGAIAPILRNEEFRLQYPDIQLFTLGTLNDLIWVLKEDFTEKEYSILLQGGFFD